MYTFWLADIIIVINREYSPKAMLLYLNTFISRLKRQKFDAILKTHMCAKSIREMPCGAL